MWRRSSALLVLAATPLLAELQRFESTEPHMGTLARIVLYAQDATAAKAAFSKAFARIRELDEKLSDYSDTSELMRLCRSSGPVQVSRDLLTVLEAAQRYALETGGAFDVTIGPLSVLWRKARRDGVPPDAADIAAARERIGFRLLSIQRGRVTLARSGMRLDLGGIAKGFAADEALAVLRAAGYRSALVALSGDIAVGSPPPGQRGWRIELSPTEGEARSVALADAGVSTSGAREQYLEYQGTRYSHILDPRTGQPLTVTRGVSAVARHAMDADALATAAAVLGPESLGKAHPELSWFWVEAGVSRVLGPKFRKP